MKDLKAQIERDMNAKLKSFGKAEKAEDRKMIGEHESRMHGVKHRAFGGAIDGAPSRGRLDRKGKGKGKKDKGKTTVNVMIGSKDNDGPVMPPLPPMPPPAMAKPPMPPGPPPGPPPGAMPPPPSGAGPGGPPPMMRADGGRLGMTAGAGSGEGRLEKADIQKKA